MNSTELATGLNVEVGVGVASVEVDVASSCRLRIVAGWLATRTLLWRLLRVWNMDEGSLTFMLSMPWFR